MENPAQVHPTGTYRYLPAINAYSSGIGAEPGHTVVGLQFAQQVPLADALLHVDEEIERRGLKPTSLAALQLRSPVVMSSRTFGSFNTHYLDELNKRGLLLEGSSPLARTNVVPVLGAPVEPVVFAAFLVVPEEGASGDFVVAGSGESVGGVEAEHIAAYSDVSQTGLRTKALFVLDIMRERLAALGTENTSPTAIGVYTNHEIDGLSTLLAAHLPACEWSGYITYPSRPPVSHIEFEMDCTRVSEWALIS